MASDSQDALRKTPPADPEIVERLKRGRLESADELEHGFHHVESLADIELGPAGEADHFPVTQEECKEWFALSVMPRLRNGVAVWANVAPVSILPTLKLGQLIRPGTPPWGTGQQILLVNATNLQQPFQPFTSVMAMPSVLFPGSTTVGQWYQIAWHQASPPTHCHQFFG